MLICFAEDCEWNDWFIKSPCDKKCGRGQMTLSRKIIRAGSHGGKLCEDRDGIMSFPCNLHQCEAAEKGISSAFYFFRGK